MRAMVFLLLLTWPAIAAPRTAVVKVDKAPVRSGASEKFDITNELPRGTTVEIVEELPGGWLKIKPPRGSFSWVNMNFLDRAAADGSIYVYAPLKEMTAPVFPGSEVIRDRRPTTVGTRLKHGELVVARGEPMQGPDGFWLPIEPPASEVRYLHQSAVDAPTGTTVTSVSARESAPAAATGPLPAPKYPSANSPRTPEEEWKEAALAEYVGNHAAAIEMYEALARKVQHTHPHIAQGAIQRASALRAKIAQPTPSAASAPTTLRSATLVGTAPRAVEEIRSTLTGEKPRPGTYKARLARAGWAIDRRPTYRIEVLLNGIYQEAGYAISGNPSIQLEPWIGQEVEVSGTIWYHGAARRNVISVTSIRAASR